MKDQQYYVYILANSYNTVLYTGITNDLHRRVLEHRSGQGGSFSSRYRVTRLVYFEVVEDVRVAISREKQIKAGSRQKKLDLVDSMNPEWNDLFLEYFT